MVTEATSGSLGRAGRAMIWMLGWLLPTDFRARQVDEWTGDLIALSAAGPGSRWRYLLAAAWTLPSLRAHSRKPGVDRPHTTIPVASVPASTMARVFLFGLGLPLLSWLIAVPLRYVLLDIPGRFASAEPFDPKDLWPADGAFIVLTPLWIALSLGAWTLLFDWLLFCWVAVVLAVSGVARRGVSRRHRLIAASLSVGLVLAGSAIPMVLAALGFEFPWGVGLTAAVLGGIAVVFAGSARTLGRRSRITVALIGLATVAVYFWHQTPPGQAMLTWYYD